MLEGIPGYNHSCNKTQPVKENLIKEVLISEKSVTVAAGESQDVNFSVTREEAGSYTVAVNGLSGSFTVVAPAKPGINWAMIGGIIAGVIVVGLGVFLWMRRRAY